MTELEFHDINLEHLGHLNGGRIKFSDQQVAFKNAKTGKLETIPASKVKSCKWTLLANTPAIKVMLKDDTTYRFGNFKESDFEKLSQYAKTVWKVDLEKEELCVKGWNYGRVAFSGPTLEFQVADRPTFDVPLANVSNAVAGKNEAILEFHPNDDCAVGLTEIRFHMAPEGQDNDNTEERIQEFLDSVIQYAGVIKDLDKPIATLEQIMANPPRGRYDIKVFANHLSFHGKTFDHKIQLKSIMRLFLLPHKDGRQMFFVIGLDPPIRQGQTRYHYVVLEFSKDDQIEVEIGLTQEQIAEKFDGKLETEMSGPTYEVVSRIMRALINQRITVPGSFVGHSGTSAISCAYKSAAGFLYPLEKGFVHVNKPPMYIRYEETDVVHFARSDVSTRSFDFEVALKNGTVHVFNSIEKDEYGRLFDFVTKKRLRIRDARKLVNPKNVDEFMGSDEEDERDHYKERLKLEAKERADESPADDDSSDAEDSDFNPEEEAKKAKNKEGGGDAGSDESDDGSEPDDEYDSDAASTSDEEGGGANASDDDEEKPKKAKKQKLASSTAKEPRTRTTKKSKKGDKDPNAPKRASSAYMVWLNENRKSIAKPGMSVTDVAKAAGVEWNKLEDKTKWQSMAQKDKERYEREMAEYKAKGGRAVSTTPAKTSSKATSSSKNVSPSKVAKSKEFLSSDESSADEVAESSDDDDE